MSISLSVDAVAVTHRLTRITRDVFTFTAVAWRTRLTQVRRRHREQRVVTWVMATGHPGVIADFERAASGR
jgi:hypothetical protein